MLAGSLLIKNLLSCRIMLLYFLVRLCCYVLRSNAAVFFCQVMPIYIYLLSNYAYIFSVKLCLYNFCQVMPIYFLSSYAYIISVKLCLYNFCQVMPIYFLSNYAYIISVKLCLYNFCQVMPI